MSARKTERLLNLVICLLAARRYLTKDEIRRAVPGYAGTQEAFDRAFERDKDELRRLGIPVRTGSNSPLFDDEVGYRIPPADYDLPELTLAPDEAAVLGLAGRAWQQGPPGRAASAALLKLKAAGVAVDDRTLAAIEPRFAVADDAFGPLWEAVRDAAPVRFSYRGARGGSPEARHVEPWGIVSWHGRWYLVGHDRDRAAPRVFRVSRVVGAVDRSGPAGSVAVPEGTNVRAVLSRLASEGPADRLARLRVRSGSGHALRLRATAQEPADGWEVLTVPYADEEALAEEVCGFGADVVALDPPEVRAAVVRRLRAVVAAR